MKPNLITQVVTFTLSLILLSGTISCKNETKKSEENSGKDFTQENNFEISEQPR